jgi:hypothetical protein
MEDVDKRFIKALEVTFTEKFPELAKELNGVNSEALRHYALMAADRGYEAGVIDGRDIEAEHQARQRRRNDGEQEGT